MRKINIKDIELDIDISYLFSIKHEIKTLYIDINGEIYFSKEDINNIPIIYANESFQNYLKFIDVKSFASEVFKEYKPVINGVLCKIKPLNNWQNIIDLNKNEMLYYDHQSDGVEIFEDSELEDYGWHASALEIDYRTLSEFIEENCEGTLLFYDNEIQFNGFAIVNDIDSVRSEVKSFIVQKAKVNIKENICELDDEDVIEALEYFGIEV